MRGLNRLAQKKSDFSDVNFNDSMSTVASDKITSTVALTNTKYPSIQQDVTANIESQLAEQVVQIETLAKQSFNNNEPATQVVENIDENYKEQDHSVISADDMSSNIGDTSLQEHENTDKNAHLQNATNEEQAKTVLQSPLESILASRNMLRSRKKALESDEKKPKGANERHDSMAVTKKEKVNTDLPDINTIPQKPFVADIIDPSIVKKANQVDRWANIIDSMALNGRLRQLALNAIIDPSSTDDLFILQLNQSTKHLNSPVALQSLQEFVSDYFSKPTAVEINIVEETIADPAKIQSQINDKRHDYARELLLSDEVVIGLQENFQAELDEKTVIAK